MASNVDVTAGVNNYFDVYVNYSAITWTGLTSPSSNTTAIDASTGIYNATIITNSNYKLTASGTDFTDGGSGTIAIANLLFQSVTSIVAIDLADAVKLTTGGAVVQDNIAFADKDTYHGYWINIPSAQLAGSYTSDVTLTYENV